MHPTHLLIELASRISNTSPHDMIYGNRTNYHGKYLAYYLLTNYGRKSSYQIAELMQVSQRLIPFALKSIEKKRSNPYRVRLDQILLEMINECETILNQNP